MTAGAFESPYRHSAKLVYEVKKNYVKQTKIWQFRFKKAIYTLHALLLVAILAFRAALFLEIFGRHAELFEEKFTEIRRRGYAYHIANIAYAVTAVLD